MSYNYVFSCKGCPDRYPGCHGKCETYKQERAEYEALKAEKEKYESVRHYTNQNIIANMDYQAKAKKDKQGYSKFHR